MEMKGLIISIWIISDDRDSAAVKRKREVYVTGCQTVIVLTTPSHFNIDHLHLT